MRVKRNELAMQCQSGGSSCSDRHGPTVGLSTTTLSTVPAMMAAVLLAIATSVVDTTMALTADLLRRLALTLTLLLLLLL